MSLQHELRALRQQREALEDQLERLSRQSSNGLAAPPHTAEQQQALEQQKEEARSCLTWHSPTHALVDSRSAV